MGGAGHGQARAIRAAGEAGSRRPRARAAGPGAIPGRAGRDPDRAHAGRRHDPAPASHADQRVLAVLRLLPHLCRRQGQARDTLPGGSGDYLHGGPPGRRGRRLFLTSGVPGRPVRAMDRMLAAVDILRKREGFSGYVHVKLLPGADSDQVREAARLASRVSINLEGPTGEVVGASPERRTSPETCCPSSPWPGDCRATRGSRADPIAPRRRAPPLSSSSARRARRTGSSWAW